MNLSGRDRQSIWHPYTQMQTADLPIAIVKGEGVYLFDENGKQYIDAVSSWWVNLHGHAHPYIADKIAEQAKKLEHVIFAGFTHEPAVEIAERILKRLPYNHSKIFFSDNGSTAVEVAIKMTIQFWSNHGEKRNKVLAFRNAYHGDTFGSMSVSERGYFTRPFNDLLFEVIFIDAPTPQNEERAIKQLKSSLIHHPSSIASFIFEPLVQGASGMLMHGAEALNEMIAICRENNVLTVADEVMTGFGRTGKYFATDYLSEKPDVICLSKGLTGGFMPMGLTSCTEDIFNAFLSSDKMNAFFHGHSYTANPLGCASALASLDLMEREETWRAIDRIGEKHIQFRGEMLSQVKLRNVRQCGTILAMELETQNDSSYFSHLRDIIYNFFLGKGILMRPLGNVMYLLPPYCISDDNLDYIYRSIKEFVSSLK
jgi:adenosylmethionine-8-amino-7-oxononanoate aminotransferase